MFTTDNHFENQCKCKILMPVYMVWNGFLLSTCLNIFTTDCKGHAVAHSYCYKLLPSYIWFSNLNCVMSSLSAQITISTPWLPCYAPQWFSQCFGCLWQLFVDICCRRLMTALQHFFPTLKQYHRYWTLLPRQVYKLWSGLSHQGKLCLQMLIAQLK